MPKITVLMPVYNAQATLREAIDSVLTQTLGDFELLVIDDASTDETPAILASYRDPRLHIMRNEQNLKIVGALNKGLALAQGDYIARMDADDISLPDRLAAQAAFLDRHGDIGIVGSWIEIFGDVSPYIHRVPAAHDDIVSLAFFANPMAHSSVMIRRTSAGQLRYSEDYPYAEDWEFWRRAAQMTKLANLQKTYVRYRVTSGHAGARDANQGKYTLLRENLRLAGLHEKDFALHLAIADRALDSMAQLAEAQTYLLQLGARNRALQIFPIVAFNRQLGAQWYMCCRAAWSNGLPGVQAFFKSPLRTYGGADWVQLSRRILFLFARWGWRGAKRLFGIPVKKPS